jgi:hypothetical protein
LNSFETFGKGEQTFNEWEKNFSPKPTEMPEVMPGSAQPMTFGASQRRMSPTQDELNGFPMDFVASGISLTGKTR